MPPEYPTETHEKKSKKKLILLLTAFTVLVSGTTAFGLLYYKTKMNSDEELANKQKTIKELEGRNANYLKQIDSLKATDNKETDEVIADNSFREVPELGVKYALNDQTKDLIPVYSGNNKVSFSNVEIANAEASTNSTPQCLLGGLGTVIKAAPSDPVLGGQTAEQLAQQWSTQEGEKNNVKKIGDSYFIYLIGNQPCYNDSPIKAKLEALITPAARQNVITALQSFKPSE